VARKPDVDVDTAKVAHLEEQLAKLGSGVEQALVNVSRDIADDVVTTVRGKVPYLTGKARNSYQVNYTSTGTEITFGGDAAPYVPWLEFGGKAGRSGASRPYVPGGRYLYPTIRKVAEDWESEILRAIEGLSDLDVM
jgi:hypothetical protein